MKKCYNCCFFGHSDIIYNKETRDKLRDTIKYLILNKNIKSFWVGNYGHFDKLCTSVIKELKKIYKDINIELVIPYTTKEIDNYKKEYYKSYNSIIVSDIPIGTPNKLYIIKNNQYIINNSSYMICYIEKKWGGAFKAYEYAKRKKLKIFNIAKI